MQDNTKKLFSTSISLIIVYIVISEWMNTAVLHLYKENKLKHNKE